MKNLKAFVAHSFDKKKDREVIREFLDYFNSLKKSSGFEWDHAEEVELKAVSQKVRDKMEGKNLFIGIFTTKKYEIEQDKLQSFINRLNYGKREHFSKGASDWIIQESGYALAKKMHLLFLIEEGVDVNVGLQGDLEFIRFSRTNPSACFVEINQTLGSIYVEPADSLSRPATASFPEAKKSEEYKEETSGGDAEINEMRKLQESYVSLKRLIVEEKDIPAAKKKLDEIIKAYEDDERFPASFWRRQFYSFKLDAGFPDTLDELDKLSEEHPDDIVPLDILGRTYKKYGQYSRAAEHFLRRAKNEKKKGKIILSLGDAAECYALDKNFSEAYKTILKEFAQAEIDTVSLYHLFKELARVAKVQDNKTLYTAFAEKALEIFPTDHELRFSLAYSYGEIGKRPSSLAHYKFLRENNPDGANLNNLGVAYNDLEMKGKSIEAFCSAFENYDYTLAAANMAYRYLDEGFLDDANSILKVARTKENCHENVDSAVARINEIRRNEEDSLTKILKSTEPETKFRIRFAEAYAMPFEANITGKWSSKHGDLPLTVMNNSIHGEIEIQFAPLARALATARMGLYGLYHEPEDEKSKKKIVINGTIINRSIEYELTSENVPSSPGPLLGHKKYVYKGLMYISDDSQVINVMEWEEAKNEVEFYEMKKIR